MGEAWFIGEPRPEDRAIFTTQTGRLSAEEMLATAESLLSEGGRATISKDGLLIVSDRVSVLSSMQHLIDQINAAPVGAWVCQFYLVHIATEKAHDLGLDPVPIARAAASYTIDQTGSTSAWAFSAEIDEVFKTSATDGLLEMVAQPLMLLTPGHAAEFKRTRTQWADKKGLTRDGIVFTESFEQFETGYTLGATLRPLSDGGALLDWSVSDTQLVGETPEGLPISDGYSMSGTNSIRSGGALLLQRQDITRHTEQIGGLLRAEEQKSRQSYEVQLWARSYRVH